MRIVIGRYETGEPFRGGDNTGSPRAKGSAITNFSGPFEAARSLYFTLGAALNSVQEPCCRFFPSFHEPKSFSVVVDEDQPTRKDRQGVAENMQAFAQKEQGNE